MNNTEKILIGFVLYLTWALLVAGDKSLTPDFVSFLKDALLGLGLYHVALKNPKE